MSMLDRFMNSNGEMFQIERNGTVISTQKGLINKDGNKKLCNFYPGTDVQEKDWLIRQETGERFFVTAIEHQRFEGKLISVDAYYQTESEQKVAANSSGSVFHIQNAYGSVIGTGNTATINYGHSIEDLKKVVNECDTPDKEDLQQIISLLELIVNDKVPASKGLFAKFSAVMERNSWITSSIAGALLSWLTNEALGNVPFLGS